MHGSFPIRIAYCLLSLLAFGCGPFVPSVPVDDRESGPHELHENAIKSLDRWKASVAHLVPPDLMIVRAQVVAVDDNQQQHGYRIFARLRIQEVFHGPAEINGHFFAAPFRRNLQTMDHLREYYPPPVVGESGIWVVWFRRGELSSPAYIRGYLSYGIGFPARDPDTAGYRVAERFAHTLRELSPLDHHERITRLQTLALGDSPELGSWAVSALAEQRSARAREFLEKLPENERPTFRAQLAVDKVLLKWDEPSWLRSTQRLKLFRRWVSAPLSDVETSCVASRLADVSRKRATDAEWQQECRSLVSTAIQNQALSLRRRHLFFNAVAYFGRRTTPGDDGRDEPTFQFLVDVIRSAPEIEIRRAAAATLSPTFSLDLGRRRLTVTELMELADDEELRKILEKVLLSTP